MKITYDKKVDALSITLKKGTYDHSKKITDTIIVDVSKKDEVLGIEILDASRVTGLIKPENSTIKISTV